jgi:hypothetical protein
MTRALYGFLVMMVTMTWLFWTEFLLGTPIPVRWDEE